jgi:hypothetical protein
VLLSGVLENVHPSAANNWLIKESQWFQVNQKQGISALKQVYKNYKQYLKRSKKQRHYVKTNFSWDKMKDLVGNILDKNIPELPTQIKLDLPKLKKIN